MPGLAGPSARKARLEGSPVPGETSAQEETFYMMEAANGMSVLELSPIRRSGYALDAIKVAIAYARDHNDPNAGIEDTQNITNNSNILYISPDIKRTDLWLSHNQLQLPFGITEYDSICKVSYIPRDVNGNFTSDGAVK